VNNELYVHIINAVNQHINLLQMLQFIAKDSENPKKDAIINMSRF